MVLTSHGQRGAWCLISDQQGASHHNSGLEATRALRDITLTHSSQPAAPGWSWPQLSPAPSPSLPNEAGRVGDDSVRVVLVLGDVVDEGEDELHPGLHQHDVSWGVGGRDGGATVTLSVCLSVCEFVSQSECLCGVPQNRAAVC